MITEARNLHRRRYVYPTGMSVKVGASYLGRAVCVLAKVPATDVKRRQDGRAEGVVGRGEGGEPRITANEGPNR